MYKFYLEFLKDGTGRVAIDEPIGFSSLVWVLKQRDKGHARDVSFNDGEAELKFVWTRNHYLEKLLFYNQIYGFESKVRLIVKINEVETILGDLDFSMSKTDGLEYFSCKVIQDSKLLTVNRHKTTKVDMLSGKDLSDNEISPLVPTNIFIKAKSVFKEGEWKQVDTYKNRLYSEASFGGSSTKNTAWYFINPCINITKSEIEGMLTFLDQTQFDKRNESYPDFCEFQVLKAEDNLKNIKININNALINLSTGTANAGDGYVDFNSYIAYGKDFNSATRVKLPLYSFLKENETFSGTLNISHTIPTLNRGESVWIFYEFKVRQSADPYPAFNPLFKCDVEMSGMVTTISADTISYGSITKGFRLSDVMNQIIKSSSGLSIKGTEFLEGGNFNNTFLFNGNLLRNIVDKPFLISLEDISNSIVEMNADYEVNDEVNFLLEEGFYKKKEIWFFDKTQFSGMSVTYNPEHTINKFTYKYKNYQSLKENEQPNTKDTIHGELSLQVQNKMVENERKIEIEWIRDSFLIEEARKKSVEITDSTSSQNDDDIFCVDCLPNKEDMVFTESSELKHEWDVGSNTLILRSTEKLNFLSIGISIDQVFIIKSPDRNAGNYKVTSVAQQEVKLLFVSGGVMTSNNDGIRFTQYTYIITKEKIPFISRTNEGVVSSENIRSIETFLNIRHSIKRNVLKYYSNYLSTCSLYQQEKDIKVTEYKNNGEGIIEIEGLKVKENDPFKVNVPILHPNMYNDMVFSNIYFDEYLEFVKKIRNDRGYFRTIGNDGNPIKAYVKNLKYDSLKKELIIDAKAKYEPVLMTLTTQNKFVIINNETSLYLLDYEIKEDKLFLYDNGRQLLYKPVFYNMVSINGSTTTSLKTFEERMILFKR